MSRPPASPPQLAGYRFLSLLGTGGFADVFLYQEERPFREVAVKVLLQGLRPQALEHFRAEADLMAKLSNHPSIVSIFAAGQAADGRPYLVMERCREGNLDARLKRRPYPVAKTLEIGIQIAGAIETAHRLGILHRDIKPANILFTEFGRPALTDFGISTSGDAAGVGAFSVLWAPPEQLASQPTGPTSDVYSLAGTMWAMLVGHSPYFVKGGDNGQFAVTQRVNTLPLPATGRPDVPDSLERVFRTAMAKDPTRRYSSVLEFARALQGVQAEQHLPVTTIDVIEERDSHDYDDQTATDTRFTTFVEIDPQLADGSTASGYIDLSDSFETRVTSFTGEPTGGSGVTGGSTAGRGGPPVMSHGYGALPATGPVDLTGPAVPVLPAERTVLAGAPPTEAPAVTQAPRRRLLPILLAAAVVVAVGGLGFLWLQQGQVGASTRAETTSPAPRPVDAVPESVPKPVDAAGTADAGQVTFTWRNAEPKDGDRFYFRPVLLDREVGVSETTEATATVPAQPGQTCLEVQVVRANGRASDPNRICVET